METLVVEFSKSNHEFETLIIKNLGEEIKNNFLESRKFNGDVANVIVTVLIPIAVPFLTVLFQKYLEKNDQNLDAEKTVILTINNEEYTIKNYSQSEISKLLIELKQNTETSKDE